MCKQQTLSELVVISVVLLVGLGRSQDSSVKSCETPKKEAGICVRIESCAALKDLLTQSRSAETFVYINNSTCDSVGTEDTYCCPLNESQVANMARATNPPISAQLNSTMTTTDTPVAEDVYEEPVDVSMSPKLKMLPLEFCGPFGGFKIIKGWAASVFQYPWMALLRFKTMSSTVDVFCGGSLINERYVLTAAHCVSEAKPQRLLVRLGELNISNATDCTRLGLHAICAPPVEEYTVEEVIPHPNFSKPMRYLNDIALLRLNETVVFSAINQHIRPICLPIGEEQKRKFEDNQKLFVTGWGVTENGTRSAQLLTGNVPILSHRICAQSYPKIGDEISSSRQICAGGSESDSCNGDSGGPLTYFGEVDGSQQIVQYGIISFGPTVCATQNKPGVYTKVGFYMDWILNTIKK